VPRRLTRPTRAPQHQALPVRVFRLALLAAVGTALLVTGVLLASGGSGRSDSVAATLTGSPLAERPSSGEVDALVAARAAETRTVSRSTLRTARVTKLRALDRASGDRAARTQRLSGEPRDVARALLPEFGLGADQFECLDALWTKESGWSHTAANPSSSAYGIPQALPGSKMASAGADWATNPATQIRWGLGYIKARYGTPCGAWAHSQSSGWY
jgi:hypothetical protein